MLLVPVPALETFVRARTRHYDPDYVSADPAFVHAHVTALAPFRDAVDDAVAARVAAITADITPFDFVLERLDTFPNGIIHLVPEPDSTFRELTRRLWEAFPDCPPYAGQFDDVRPHLTLDARSAEVSEASTRAALAGLLPARCRAEQLDLARYSPGDCRVLRSWTFGRVTVS